MPDASAVWSDGGRWWRVNDLALAHQHRAFERVLHLADVARPVIADEHVDRGRGDALDALAVLVRELLEEVVGQQQEVGLPIAQRRHEDREHVQPVVQVLAERAVRERLLHVLVRRRDEPDVHLDGFGPAHALELALLQHAQELDLRGQVDVADLVKEQRAAFRQLEAALLPLLPRR